MLAASFTLALGFVCYSAEADPIGSHWEAQQFLAEHQGTSEVLIASYERVHIGNQPARETIMLGIANDYAYIDEGSRRTIVDAKLRRIISIDLTSGAFHQDSTYSLAAFVEYEAWNRAMIGEVLRRAGSTDGVPPSNFDTFWIESELGNTIEDQSRPDIGMIETAGAIAFSYGGTDVATASFSDQMLSGAQKDRLRNLLRLFTQLHPEVLARIVAVGRLPRTLMFRMPSDPDVNATTYTLESFRIENAGFPLTVDAEPSFIGDHPFLATVRPVMEAAVSGTWPSGAKERDYYFVKVRDAVNRKAWFAALMLQTELSLYAAHQSGGCTDELEREGICIDLLDFRNDLLRDERVRLYLQAQNIQNTEPVRAVEIWLSIPLEDVSNAYLMGVFVGNVVSTYRDSFKTAPVDPYAKFASAIMANPYVSSFYKDLGDHFRRQLEFGLAWTCYDLGRALPNRPRGDVLAHVDLIEGQLRQQVPQLF